MPDVPSREALSAGRELYADAYYRLRQQRALGDADALVHILEQAERAGVPQQDRDQLAREGFREITRRLVPPPKARRGIRRWLHDGDDEPPRPDGRALPPGAAAPRELPPPG